MNTLLTRFDAKVDRSGGPDACWPWTASRDAHGYGQIKCSILKRPLKAHRIALEAHLGHPIPESMKACHRCDNPPCCNPSHLFIGTQSDNMADCGRKGRHPGPGLHGGDHPIAKLSESDVIEIRRLYATEKLTQTELGRQFGVGQAAISGIILRKSWTHI